MYFFYGHFANFQYCLASILKNLNAYLVSYFNSNEFSRSVIECFNLSVYQAPDSLLALQDKSLFASFKFWSDLVMVGQSKLMPGQIPGSGYASGTPK